MNRKCIKLNVKVKVSSTSGHKGHTEADGEKAMRTHTLGQSENHTRPDSSHTSADGGREEGGHTGNWAKASHVRAPATLQQTVGEISEHKLESE